MVNEERDEKKRKEKTSSGHFAGIQTASEFGETERELKRQREEELKRFNAAYNDSSEVQETVFRDKQGKKVDMLSELTRQQQTEEIKKRKLEEAQQEWGKGAVQKKDREERAIELAEMAFEPFARTIEDPKLEELKKKELREGDPMAKYFEKKMEKKEQIVQFDETGKEIKKRPVYKGPIPTPNRFGIHPGYRWDAINRGNGFEHKLLTKLNDKNSLREDGMNQLIYLYYIYHYGLNNYL